MYDSEHASRDHSATSLSAAYGDMALNRPKKEQIDEPRTETPGLDAWLNKHLRIVGGEITKHLGILGSLLVVLWLLEIADQLFWHESLDFLGIQPRTRAGLYHLYWAPFLHKGFGHLVANTFPFLMLGWLVLLHGLFEFLVVSFLATTISGLGIWLLGMPGTVHIGLSGVVFGFLGFLLLRGYFKRSAAAIGLALLVGLLYGSMLWGVLPIQPNVSWLGHLFGFVGGGFAASLLAKRTPALRQSL